MNFTKNQTLTNSLDVAYSSPDDSYTNKEDGYFATDGMCTHEDVHLEDGLVMDDEIECPMHQGIFNIKSGEALSPPACEDLKTYPVKVENDLVYINIS